MDRERSTVTSGVKEKIIEPARIIEDGEVRTVVEALLQYGTPSIILTYKLPKPGTEIQVDVRVVWNEKNKMLKLSILTVFEQGHYIGKAPYGVTNLPTNGDETVAQK